MAGVKGLYNQENVNNLHTVLSKLLIEMDAFGMYKVHQKDKLDLAQHTFNKFLNRLKLNFEGLNLILPLYATQPAMFHPISHIMRTVEVDFLNFCYLATFYNPEADDLESFSNELDHFDRDFLKSAQEIASVQVDLPNNNPQFPKREDELNDQTLTSLRKGYKHLYKDGNIDSKLKSSREIRYTSDHQFFTSMDEIARPGNGMISEKYKYERLLKTTYKKYADVYLLYKYFTQQYHFSNISNRLLEKDVADNNFYYLVWALNHAFIVTDMLIQSLDGTESKFLKRLRELNKDLEKSLTDD